MAQKKQEKEKELEVGAILSRSEQFIEKNKKLLSYGIIGVAAVIGLIMAYHYGYAMPHNERAKIAIFRGEQFFERDSFSLALNGNGIDFEGFEAIADQYGSTKTGNLAKAYTGICYYKLGDPQTAIKWLKSYKGSDHQIAPAMTGLIGDCYVSTGETKEAIGYFEKAAAKADNDLLSPVYLKKAGIAYESLNQYKEAIKVYTTIREKYNRSTEAMDIDRYITRAEILAKQQ
ncbi:MAG: tetratricopeptide repeat protein [Tannerella sp.]|jgi:tetratricopeptide (TPR) repeat protein|nr:tetratricopeptide repeat protein [Tannerella sp.]